MLGMRNVNSQMLNLMVTIKQKKNEPKLMQTYYRGFSCRPLLSCPSPIVNENRMTRSKYNICLKNRYIFIYYLNRSTIY